MRPIVTLASAALLLAACAPRSTRPAPEGAGPLLPPIPARQGALDIRVVYPGEGQRLGVRDSTFIFGEVGTGGAELRINGAPVEVRPNGAWLAFLPVPQDGVYRLEASAAGQTDRHELRVELPAAPASAPDAAAVAGEFAIVPGSHMPRGAFVETEGAPVEVRFRGRPGGTARLRLPGGVMVPLAERPAAEQAEGFMLDRTERVGGVAEYAGTFAARRVAPGDTAVIELIHGADTARVPLDFTMEVLAPHAPRVAVAASGRADRTVIGTAVPGSGTPYHWFFPSGARLTVTGARGDQFRVRLTDGLSVWVDTAEVDLLPEGTPAPRGYVGTVRATPYADHVDIRFSTSEAFPFRVDPQERGLRVTLYGAESRTNWLQYGATDPLLRRMEWEAVGDAEYQLQVELAEPLWGYHAFYDDEGDIIVRVRRPPPIDPANPLRGLYVAVDAGHPPGGAVGPTGFTEAEANLAISKRLVAMLRERGARVLETRPDTAAVGLGSRPLEATDSSVHVLVSVHNNAFPDGVNPWENNGTSVFYNQAQSLDLARAFQAELLREFRLRDLGIARADLALVRPTWMPSALTETMFLMIPQQEAALRDPEVQQRIARAHLRALEAFLRGRAGQGRQ